MDEIMITHADTYKEEIALSEVMKSDIKIRPKSILKLKETTEYINWIASIPPFIPYYFENATQ
jgi:hypothetical protein